MPTCYVDIVIEPTDKGHSLFQIECAAEIEYEVHRGTLNAWTVSDFRFDHYASRWSDAKAGYAYVKVAETWATDTEKLFKLLMPFVDMADLEAKLLDHLASEGELSSPSAALRADYHARVL